MDFFLKKLNFQPHPFSFLNKMYWINKTFKSGWKKHFCKNYFSLHIFSGSVFCVCLCDWGEYIFVFVFSTDFREYIFVLFVFSTDWREYIYVLVCFQYGLKGVYFCVCFQYVLEGVYFCVCFQYGLAGVYFFRQALS